MFLSSGSRRVNVVAVTSQNSFQPTFRANIMDEVMPSLRLRNVVLKLLQQFTEEMKGPLVFEAGLASGELVQVMRPSSPSALTHSHWD